MVKQYRVPPGTSYWQIHYVEEDNGEVRWRIEWDANLSSRAAYYSEEDLIDWDSVRGRSLITLFKVQAKTERKQPFELSREFFQGYKAFMLPPNEKNVFAILVESHAVMTNEKI